MTSPHQVGSYNIHIWDNLRANTDQPLEQENYNIDRPLWEKKTIEEKIFLKFTLTAKRKNWEWIFFEQPAHSLTPAGASGDLSGEFHNILAKTLKVGENWRNRTHLVTSVIILPEFGEHWGHGGRLPFYRGRAREDEPVRNISNKFTGIS